MDTNLLLAITNVIIAIGLLSLSIACYKAEKKIKTLEQAVKALTEKSA